jgi:hypothetical protein
MKEPIKTTPQMHWTGIQTLDNILNKSVARNLRNGITVRKTGNTLNGLVRWVQARVGKPVGRSIKQVHDEIAKDNG